MTQASSVGDASKAAAMAQLTKLSADLARKATWKELEKSVFVQMIQQMAKSIGVRLTKAKLSQVIPVVGSLTGGGFNAYYTSKVCNAAYYLYRERFLLRKMSIPYDGNLPQTSS